jgi:hypothetical protein
MMNRRFRRPLRRMVSLTFVASAVLMAVVTTDASAASIVAAPSSVAAGGSVRLSGDVLGPGGTPGCTVPSTVTLVSDAFAGLGEFAGVGAVSLAVDSAGRFDQSVTLGSAVAPGTYQITGRCGGGNLGVTATLIVQLPRTGPAAATATALKLGILLIVGGFMLLMLIRPKTSAIPRFARVPRRRFRNPS